MGYGEEKGYVPLVTWKRQDVDKSTMLRSGSLPWSLAAEESFRDLKRLVIGSVDLYSPDIPAAMSGERPYYGWPDTCGYGVGLGTFQFGPKADLSSIGSVLTSAGSLTCRAIATRAKARKDMRGATEQLKDVPALPDHFEEKR